MSHTKGQILKLLVDFFEDDYRRIAHAMDVLICATFVMAKEKGYDEDVVTACALLHDIGIKPSEKELGYNNGKTQEKYGPPLVREFLNRIDFPAEKIDRVMEIVGNHHSRPRYDYVELKILKEADSMVNSGRMLG